MAPNLGARAEDGLGVPHVLVFPVLNPEVPDFFATIAFLVYNSLGQRVRLGFTLSFEFSWLARVLLTGVSLAASDQHSQYWASMVCDMVRKS